MFPSLGQQAQDLVLGWGFYGPLIGMVVMILLGVRIWVVIGLGSMAMLYFTEVLPLTLLGEALFDGVDSFALIAGALMIYLGQAVFRPRPIN